jgi:hypothetical protein
MSNLYYRGDTIFLYVQFTDQQGNICSADKTKVRILHDKDGTVYEDLPWKNMQQMGYGEYFYNFKIANDADIGQYQIIYQGIVDGQEAYVIEVFHTIARSDKYPNAIKLYGYINDIRALVPLADSNVMIYDVITNEAMYQTIANLDGYWEAYLYPGEYKFVFSQNGYNPIDITAQIGDEHTEIQFNNIGLENETASQTGNGMYPVNDRYITKHNTPLTNLVVSIANVNDPTNIIAKDTTDKDGNWQCFLNPGVYIMKLTGNALNKDFNKTFRIKVEDNGQFKFEDLTKNVASVASQPNIGSGDGTITVADEVKDKNGNPIIDVQVNAFKKGVVLDDKNIIAQDYTDVQGKWALQLETGNYTIEFYHPNFKVFTEERKV